MVFCDSAHILGFRGQLQCRVLKHAARAAGVSFDLTSSSAWEVNGEGHLGPCGETGNGPRLCPHLPSPQLGDVGVSCPQGTAVLMNVT